MKKSIIIPLFLFMALFMTMSAVAQNSAFGSGMPSTMGGATTAGRVSSVPSSYGSSAGSSYGAYSAPRFSLNGSTRSASASHSTYSPNSGRSTNSLGLTISLSSKDKRLQSSGMVASQPTFSKTTSSRSSGVQRSPSINTRTVGDLATTTNDNDGGTDYQIFDESKFKDDTTPTDATPPVGDPILPMLILLSLLVAYCRLRR